MTTTPDRLASLKTAVGAAVQGVEAAYGGLANVEVLPDGQGGAWVRLGVVPLSETYTTETSFAVFLLPFNLPGSDIYPLFLRPDLARRDGAHLGPAFQQTQLTWPGAPAQMAVVQVSRRTRGDFTAQTPAQKVEKVLDWVRQQ